jgi:hypothetical protein
VRLTVDRSSGRSSARPAALEGSRHGLVLRAWPSYETRYLCAEAPSETLERMTRTELLDAATEKLVEAAKLLDRADEDTLADDALELAERVNIRISLN